MIFWIQKYIKSTAPLQLSVEGPKHVKMSSNQYSSGAWWLEKETNDVIRIISKDSVYDIDSLRCDEPVDGEEPIYYQYYTDDANRNLNTTQWVATATKLDEKFTFKAC